MLTFRWWLNCALILAPAFAFADDEPSPEVRAQIKLHTTTLRTSKKAAERQKAADALGAMGASAKSARRDLCQSMLDGATSVRGAAADALKKVDEPMYKLATAIFINVEVAAIRQAGGMKDAAEPLTPLVLSVAGKALANIQALAARKEVGHPMPQQLELHRECMTSLAEIAKSDVGANRLLIAALAFQLPPVQPSYPDYSRQTRTVALRGVRGMANVKQGLKVFQSLAATDDRANRIAAIEILTDIIDNDNRPAIKKTIESMRFDNDAEVRKAIDAAMKKIDAGN